MFRTIVAALAVASVIHGFYDFLVLGLAPKSLPVAAALIIAVWIWRLYEIRYLHDLPPGPCPQDETAA